MYNEYLETYIEEYKTLSNNKKRKLGNTYDPIKIFLEAYNYAAWFESETLQGKVIKKNL